MLTNFLPKPYINKNIIHDQWRSQPDNLDPLCKFQTIIFVHFNEHETICIAGLNRRAGYATVVYMTTLTGML